MLEAQSLSAAYGPRVVYQDLSFRCSKGTIIQLQGPNGSGKTTLLRHLAGLLPEGRGTMVWEERGQISGNGPSDCFFLPYEAPLRTGFSVEEQLQWQMLLQGCDVSTQRLLMELEAVGLATHRYRPVSKLSSGQKKRLLLAALFLSPASVWLLDEPFHALDVQGITMLQERMRAHVAQEGLVVFSHHGICAWAHQTIAFGSDLPL